jgi:peroxiredoxin
MKYWEENMRIWIGILLLVLGAGYWARNNTFPGKTAPDFSLPTTSGERVKLSDQRGKVVLLDFWATWCPPCRASLPHLQEASDNDSWADRGLVVWAVNDQQSEQEVTNFLADSGFTFPALVDREGTVVSEYGVHGIPMTVIVGRDGKVWNTFVGWGDDSAHEIDAAIEKALAEPQN